MIPFRAAAFAALVFATASAAAAAEPVPGATADNPRAVRAGPAPDDPDRDDAGVFFWDAWGDCAVVPRFSRDVVAHGAPTGDQGKDSLDFRVADHDGCAGGAAR